MNDQKHIFALYYPDLAQCKGQLAITDVSMLHRITRVLRLRSGESLMLFDGVHACQAVIEELNEQRARVRLGMLQVIEQPTPPLTVMLAVLKHDALEAAIESLVQCGVQRIQLYACDKMQRNWGGDKEYARLKRVMIAAAEQSKQFIQVSLDVPLPLDAIRATGVCLWCDVSGDLFIDLAKPAVMSGNAITVLIGPEGDFTSREKKHIVAVGFVPAQLTRGILRSYQAAFLAAGIIRSMRAG